MAHNNVPEIIRTGLGNGHPQYDGQADSMIGSLMFALIEFAMRDAAHYAINEGRSVVTDDDLHKSLRMNVHPIGAFWDRPELPETIRRSILALASNGDDSESEGASEGESDEPGGEESDGEDDEASEEASDRGGKKIHTHMERWNEKKPQTNSCGCTICRNMQQIDSVWHTWVPDPNDTVSCQLKSAIDNTEAPSIYS